jgi:hypothetical protein
MNYMVPVGQRRYPWTERLVGEHEQGVVWPLFENALHVARKYYKLIDISQPFFNKRIAVEIEEPRFGGQNFYGVASQRHTIGQHPGEPGHTLLTQK